MQGAWRYLTRLYRMAVEPPLALVVLENMFYNVHIHYLISEGAQRW